MYHRNHEEDNSATRWKTILKSDDASSIYEL